METMPPRLKGRRYYQPGELGLEKEIKKRLEWWAKIKEKITKEAQPAEINKKNEEEEKR